MKPLATPALPAKILPWGNRLSRGFGRFFLRLLGWQFKGQIPNVSKAVLIAAPHTSNWDWPIGMFAILAVGIKVFWLGKASFVNSPIKGILTYLGGIPVERNSAKGLVAQTATAFNKQPHFLLALAPEGTRGAVKRWKLGYYHIAKAAHVPIVPVALDYGRKCIKIGPAIDAQAEMAVVGLEIAKFYEGIVGKNHAQAALTIDKIVGL